MATLPFATTIAGDLPDAAQSDPVARGWMVGSPPAAEKTIRVGDGSFMKFPQLRWSLGHWRELFPTRNVSRGNGPVAPLPAGKPADLDGLTFKPIGTAQTMTWAQSLGANYTDGIVVLHRGRVVYERYLPSLGADQQHIAFSVTKSFIGTLAAMLVAEGKLDPGATVTKYIPELADSAFGDATVGQVLDMTTALDYSEDYADPNASFVPYARAAGMLPSPPGYTGPGTSYDFLKTLKKNGAHGVEFHYRSPNTDVLGWLIWRVTGRPADVVLQERVWSKLGAEGDAYMALDRVGAPLAAGGLNMRLRDLARFGEMIRLGGKWNGQQVVPAAVVDDIRGGASREAFRAAGYATLPGWSYHDQWWISHDDHGMFMARGIHGQAIYIDPKAEMVIARFASHPKAANVNLDPTSLPAYRAAADYLLLRGK
ncbi:MAG: serine hydrolase [Gammaproteobacteria bacterium]|nr:serine hydrolase [Gammaproteobacteria bacterium]